MLHPVNPLSYYQIPITYTLLWTDPSSFQRIYLIPLLISLWSSKTPKTMFK